MAKKMNGNAGQMNFDLLPDSQKQKTRPELNGIDKKLYSLLPTGKEHPINAADLARLLKVNDRTVRAIIRRLRVKYLLPIGSSKSDPSGYYKISNLNEYLQAVTFFDHAASESLLVKDCLTRSKWGKMLTVTLKIPKDKSEGD